VFWDLQLACIDLRLDLRDLRLYTGNLRLDFSAEQIDTSATAALVSDRKWQLINSGDSFPA